MSYIEVRNMPNNMFNYVMDIAQRYYDMAKDARQSGNIARANEYESLAVELLDKYGVNHAIRVA